VTVVLVKVAEPVTFDVPSNAPLVYVRSPVVEIVLPVARAVAVLALPVNAPVNPVDVTEANPVTEVTVPPNVMVVDPNTVELFANCAFVMAALLAKLLVVNPVAEIVPEAIDIPEPAVKGD